MPVQLDLQTSPLADLWFQARSHAEVHQELVLEHPLAELASAMRALGEALGGPRGWARVEGHLLGCATAEEFSARLRGLPGSLEVGSQEHPRSVPMTQLVAPVALALVEAEAGWLAGYAGSPARESRFPDSRFVSHVEELALARAQWQALSAQLPGLYSDLLDQFHLRFESAPHIPVVLVTQLPKPGAMTLRTRQGPACFIGVRSIPAGPSLLREVIVHESLHALDALAGDQPSLLRDVRMLLRAADLEARDVLRRDVPHALFFFAAAQAVREHGAEEHVDYGQVSGLYSRLPKAAAALRAPWLDYAAGRLERRALLERVELALWPE